MLHYLDMMTCLLTPEIERPQERKAMYVYAADRTLDKYSTLVLWSCGARL